MHILCVAATSFEILPLVGYLSDKGREVRPGFFRLDKLDVQVLVTGVGILQTAYHLGSAVTKNRPDFVLNLGVAGTFDRSIRLGEVVEVSSERIGDLGAEDAQGGFLDLSDMGLLQASGVFNENGIMINTGSAYFYFLKKVNAITVNKVHGHSQSIEKVMQKYPDVQIESMEGAAVFYVCLNEKIPFIEIRSISNYVEPRNKESWELPRAIKNLNKVAVDLFKSISGEGLISQ